MNTLAKLTTILLAAGCALSAGAFEHDGPPGRPGQHGPHPHADLSEAQQDRLFALMHAQEPQRREQERAARKAHEALRDLAESGKFDEARAAALAQAEGKAVAALALLRARLDAQVAALLTPEQRQRTQQYGSGRGSRPPAP